MGSVLDGGGVVGEKAHQGIFWGRQERMSGLFATANPRRIKAAHRRRRKVAVGPIVQRYYDPTLGRFLSVDPVTANSNTGANFNRYYYANNNPYKFTDPDGRLPIIIPIIAAITWLMTSGDANAPAPGEATSSMSSGEAAASFANAVPAGRLASGVRMAVDVKKTHTTYTRGKSDGTTYSGKTSGKGTPEQQVAARTSQPDHKAKTQEGYGPASVDKNSPNANAVRGREQQLINQNGGAQSQGGTSGNKINGVSPTNQKAETYRAACKKEFGC